MRSLRKALPRPEQDCIIASGHRLKRLNSLKTELSGLETVQIDAEDVENLKSYLNAIKTYPDLDSVLFMAGKMELLNFIDLSPSSSRSIISESTTNFIAPMLISRTMISHF